jgi:glutathione S-transferase
MYRLYIANKNYSSWSLRPWLLLRQLQIPFTEQLVPFEGAATFQSFRNFSPTGRVPCLIDGDTVVWDSLAITEYLAEQHRTVWPAAAAARAWARSAAAEMHSGFTELRQRCGMNCGLRIRLHEITAGLQRDLGRIDELWSESLQRFGGPFLAGAEFTAVDAFFAPVAFRIQTYSLQLGAPAAAYAARLLELPAMRSWYQDALAERWRDVDHDQEVAQYGTVLHGAVRHSAAGLESELIELARNYPQAMNLIRC